MYIAMLDENSLILFFLFFFTNSFAGIAPGGRPVLSFVVGDDIEVINKHDPEWWEVRSPTVFSIGYVFACLTSLQLKTLHSGKGEELEIFIKAGLMDDSISCPDVGH